MKYRMTKGTSIVNNHNTEAVLLSSYTNNIHIMIMYMYVHLHTVHRQSRERGREREKERKGGTDVQTEKVTKPLFPRKRYRRSSNYMLVTNDQTTTGTLVYS